MGEGEGWHCCVQEEQKLIYVSEENEERLLGRRVGDRCGVCVQTGRVVPRRRGLGGQEAWSGRAETCMKHLI